MESEWERGKTAATVDNRHDDSEKRQQSEKSKERREIVLDWNNNWMGGELR